MVKSGAEAEDVILKRPAAVVLNLMVRLKRRLRRQEVWPEQKSSALP